MRMVLEYQDEHEDSQGAAIVSVATKIGCSANTPRNWVRQAEGEGGAPGLTTEERQRLKAARAGERRATAGERRL